MAGDADRNRPLRLRARLRPATGESATGWLLRLAEANGYPHWNWLRPHPRKHTAKLRRPTLRELAGVAELAGIGMDEVAELGTVDTDADDITQTSPQTAYSPHLNLINPKVCPQCLADKGALAAAWDLMFWVACPFHGTEMLGHCPGCETPLSWHRPAVGRCCETFPLKDFRPPPVEGAVLELMQLFAERLGAAPVGTGQVSTLLRGLTVRNLTDLISELDLLTRFGTRLSGRERWRTPSSTGAMTAVRTAAEVFDDWPAAFRRLLDRMDITGAGTPLRPFIPHSLRRLVYQTEGLFFMSGEIDFFQRKQQARLGNPQAERRAAARRLPSDMIRKREAAELLGVGVDGRPENLIASGLIRGAVLPKGGSRDKTELLFSVTSIGELLARFKQAAEDGGATIIDGSDLQGPHLVKLKKLAYRADSSLASILSNVLRLHIAPAAVIGAATGLDRYLFDKRRYREAVFPGRKKGHGMGLLETAAEVAVTGTTVWHLVDAGLIIAAASEREKGVRASIDRCSVTEFLAVYVSTGLLAREYGLTPWQVHLLLRQMNVNRGPAGVWLRSDIENIRPALDRLGLTAGRRSVS